MSNSHLFNRFSHRFYISILFFYLFITYTIDSQTVYNKAISLYEQGMIAFDQGQVLDSIQFFQQAVELNNSYGDAYREAGRSFYYLGEFDEAELYIMNALKLAPENIETLNLYGKLLIVKGRTDEAETLFSKVLKTEPFNIDAHIGLGELAAARGNNLQAQGYYEDFLKLDPDDYRVLLSLAFVYYDARDISQAKDYVIAALESDGQNPWNLYYAADFYMLIGDLEEAEYYALQSLDLQPNFSLSLELLSRVYVEAGRYDLALSTINRSDPQTLVENEKLLFTRAIAEYNSADVSTAIHSLEILIAFNPDNEPARLLLEDILIHEKNFDDQQREKYALFHFNRAKEYAQRNQYDSARYHYIRGLTLAPFSLEGRRSYARFFREAKEYALYLNQLTFLQDQLLITDTELVDSVEIYSDLLRDSVSNSWGIDQFTVERGNFKLAFFVSNEGQVLHSGIESLIASHIMDQLYSSSRISFFVSPGINSLDYEAIRSGSEAENFAGSRANNVDYYILLSVNEYDERIELEIAIYLGRTGRKLQNFRVIRSGNNRVKDAVLQITDKVLTAFPIRGSIIERNFETALVNLGQIDGLSEGDELLLIKPSDLFFSNDTLFFSYEQETILGQATIIKSDVFISEVNLRSDYLFDQIQIGDIAFLHVYSDSKETSLHTEATPINSLYERIRTIR